MEGPEDAQIMLSRAVECCPTSVEVKFMHGHRLFTAINVNINIIQGLTNCLGLRVHFVTNETCFARNETFLARNKTCFMRNETRGGNLLLSGILCMYNYCVWPRELSVREKCSYERCS